MSPSKIYLIFLLYPFNGNVMTQPFLTIGMPYVDDYDSCWAILQQLREYNDLSRVELLVVDNKPRCRRSALLKYQIEHDMQDGCAGARYVAMPNPKGSAPAKNRVFAESRGRYTLCIDCHVILRAGVIAKLIAYFEQHPDTSDLLSGPLLCDNLRDIRTHYEDIWSFGLRGVWAQVWWAPRTNARFSAIRNEADRSLIRFVKFGRPEMPYAPLDGTKLAYDGYEAAMISRGYRTLDGDGVLAIPAQCCALMACRAEAWLKFNENFIGYGAEELYIHEKFRRAGHRVLCLGFLQWTHRFTPPGGILPQRPCFEIVRNFVIGHQEFSLPLTRMKAYFVPSRLPVSQWNRLRRDAIGASLRGPARKHGAEKGSG